MSEFSNLYPEKQFVKDDLEKMMRAVNYINYQYEMISPFIGKAIIEIGSGIGNITQKIIPSADWIIALEPNPFCYFQLISKFNLHRNIEIINDFWNEKIVSELSNRYIDTVVCINVLEHIKDDSEALKNFYKILCKKGRIVLVVPAHSWAYGTIDQAVGHFRRYSRNALYELLHSANFQITYCRFFNIIGLIGWLINAKISHRKAQSDFQIKIFDKIIVPIMKKIEQKFYFPIGQSLLIVAEKI